MVIIAFSFYSTIGPLSLIVELNHYSRPYQNRNIIFQSTLVIIIFFVCLLVLNSALHHYLYWLVVY